MSLIALINNNILCPEKCRNEKVLAEEYTKRKQQETQLESVIAKHKTVAQKNVKMKEAMKVAEMKVAQTQAQVKMYTSNNNLNMDANKLPVFETIYLGMSR